MHFPVEDQPPYFTIITPSFNQGKYIGRTIESVLTQTFRSFEYLVFDGGSSDDTLAILKAFGESIRWTSEPDRGQAHAVNKGLLAARGQVIGWLNSDDLYYQGALEAVHDIFSNHPEVEILYGMADHIDENDSVIEPYYNEEWNYDRLKEICFLSQPAVFFRKSVVDECGLLDETLRYCMDYEYWLRIGVTKTPYYLKRRLAGSRLHGETKTLSSTVGVHREILSMFQRKFREIPDKWIFAHAHAVAGTLGLDRDKPLDRLRFVVRVVAVSLWDSVRLRHSVPLPMAKVLGGWLFSVLRHVFRKEAV